MRSRHRVLLSVLAIVGMLASLAATCAAGSLAPEHEQMACCKAGHHACGTPTKPADCCKTNGDRERHITAAKTVQLTQPVWTALAWAMPALFAEPPAIGGARPIPVDTSPPLQPNRPVYIKFAVLLI